MKEALCPICAAENEGGCYLRRMIKVVGEHSDSYGEKARNEIIEGAKQHALERDCPNVNLLMNALSKNQGQNS